MKNMDLFSSGYRFTQVFPNTLSYSDMLTKAIENAEEHAFDKGGSQYPIFNTTKKGDNTKKFKSFAVKYKFSYDKVDSNNKFISCKSEVEEDIWEADSVELAILLTYQNFPSFEFCEKHKDKKNIQFHSIVDVYVKLDPLSCVSYCYSSCPSEWNENFRAFQRSLNINNN